MKTYQWALISWDEMLGKKLGVRDMEPGELEDAFEAVYSALESWGLSRGVEFPGYEGDLGLDPEEKESMLMVSSDEALAAEINYYPGTPKLDLEVEGYLDDRDAEELEEQLEAHFESLETPYDIFLV